MLHVSIRSDGHPFRRSSSRSKASRCFAATRSIENVPFDEFGLSLRHESRGGRITEDAVDCR